MAQFEKLFIGIAGIIGAGKSTLAGSLGEHMGIDVYYDATRVLSDVSVRIAEKRFCSTVIDW